MKDFALLTAIILTILIIGAWTTVGPPTSIIDTSFCIVSHLCALFMWVAWYKENNRRRQYLK